jgi:hypothetical protein
MRTPLVFVALIGSLILRLATVAAAQDTPQPTGSSPARTGAPIPVFTPGVDDLMTILIQTRHSKLYYAGSQKNWELAAFEMGELRAAFRRIAQMYPKYIDNSVGDALRLIMEPKLRHMDAAIAAADLKQFTTAYREITAGCNSCHNYMERPFLVIKVPEAAPGLAVADQDFRETDTKVEHVER